LARKDRLSPVPSFCFFFFFLIWPTCAAPRTARSPAGLAPRLQAPGNRNHPPH